MAPDWPDKPSACVCVGVCVFTYRTCLDEKQKKKNAPSPSQLTFRPYYGADVAAEHQVKQTSNSL